MKAHLVTFCFTTRVVVPDNFTEESIFEAGIQNMITRIKATPNALREELSENIEQASPDTECPFDPETDKPGSYGFFATNPLLVYYQPT